MFFVMILVLLVRMIQKEEEEEQQQTWVCFNSVPLSSNDKEGELWSQQSLLINKLSEPRKSKSYLIQNQLWRMDPFVYLLTLYLCQSFNEDNDSYWYHMNYAATHRRIDRSAGEHSKRSAPCLWGAIYGV